MTVKIGKMVGAGPYYGIPLNELHLEWSHEEELEIERYCEKMLKNCAEEEMTPLERFKASMEGKPRDRQLITVGYFPLYATRTLDSCADAIKPIDVYRYPKLLLKAHMAIVARFKMDVFRIDSISYGEEIWGADSKFIEYGNPVVMGDMPIKSVADMEGLEAADPRKHGMFPQYLWFGREVRRIFTKYGLDKVMPLEVSFCDGPEAQAMVHMVGMSQYMIALRKDPELCRKSAALATEFSIKYATAVCEEVKPDALFYCNMIGAMPMKGMEWVVDEYAKIGKALTPYRVPMHLGFAFQGCVSWLPALWEGGAVGLNGFTGFEVTAEVGHKPMVDFSREHDLFCACAMSDKALTAGAMAQIEEDVKQRCDYAKPYHKYGTTVGAVDYWTPQAEVDAAMDALKKYGKY